MYNVQPIATHENELGSQPSRFAYFSIRCVGADFDITLMFLTTYSPPQILPPCKTWKSVKTIQLHPTYHRQWILFSITVVQDKLALCHCTIMRETILSITRYQDDFEFWKCRLRFIVSVTHSDGICKKFYHSVFLRLSKRCLHRKRRQMEGRLRSTPEVQNFLWWQVITTTL